jgi:hypothetical protein
MYEHVGGREDLGHALGEAVDAHERLLRECALEPLLKLLVAPCQAHDRAHSRDLGDLAHGALDVADAPAAA